MSFEKDIVGSIPLAEAATFFVKLKTAESEPYAPPDETGSMEGQFAAPTEQVLQLMAKMVENEFKTMYAYKVYAESLRGPEHFAVSKEFEEHAENELEHAEFLLRRMAVLGGPVQVPDIPSPPPASDVMEIVQTMVRMEQEGIQNWKNLLQLVGDDNPTKHVIEGFLEKELHHLDELWQMLPYTANRPVLQPHAQMTPPTPQLQAGATPPTNAPDQSGMSPPAATEKKEASVKLAAAHQRVMRKKATGNFDVPGEATAAMDDLIKSAGAKMREKVAGIGGSYDWRPMNAIPNSAGDPNAAVQQPTTIQVNMPSVGSYQGKDTASGPTAPIVPKAKPMGGGGGGGGDDMGLGGLDFGKEGMAKAAARMRKAAKNHENKGRERAETNLAARARQTEGMRGELYGDIIGRLLGGYGGFAAGKNLENPLARVGGAAVTQMLGGRIGKQLGREVDSKRNKKLAGVKSAFEDTMNMLAQEQAAEQAQVANEAQFYRDRNRQAQEAQQTLQKALEAAQNEAEQQKQQMASLQEAMQQQTTMSNDATTKALMQTVQANNDALQSRQLANDSSSALQKLKQTLREIAGDADGGANSGMGGAGGEPASGPDQQGPAGQAVGAGNSPTAAPPEGDKSTNPGPIESPQSMSASDGGAARNMGQMDLNRPQTGDQNKSASSKIAAMGEMMRGALKKAPYALGGAALTGGLHALSLHQGSEGLRQEVAEHANKPAAGFGQALQQAQQKARLALAEASEAHPVASTALASLAGAGMGASLGPALAKRLKRAPQDVKTLAGG